RQTASCSAAKTRRQGAICRLGRVDGGSAFAIVDPRTRTENVPAGTSLRCALGRDRCRTSASTIGRRMRSTRTIANVYRSEQVFKPGANGDFLRVVGRVLGRARECDQASVASTASTLSGY